MKTYKLKLSVLGLSKGALVEFNKKGYTIEYGDSWIGLPKELVEQNTDYFEPIETELPEFEELQDKPEHPVEVFEKWIVEYVDGLARNQEKIIRYLEANHDN